MLWFLSVAADNNQDMVCLCCHRLTPGRVCPKCAGTIDPAPDRLLRGGLRVVGAFAHEGAAKSLLHHLKYRGVVAIAEVVADLLESRLPVLPLVPVPRTLSRRIKYGIDPARVIASSLARRLGVPVLDALAPPIHSPRRAGRDHGRPVGPYRLRHEPPGAVILVDDVVTTGATAIAATMALHTAEVRLVAAASVVPQLSNVTAA